jgi:cytochrome P450
MQTVSALDTFYLAMVLNPSCQRLAQEELDMVVGRTRLPDYNDRPHLPYINALILEILRWNPVTPMGMLLPFPGRDPSYVISQRYLT